MTEDAGTPLARRVGRFLHRYFNDTSDEDEALRSLARDVTLAPHLVAEDVDAAHQLLDDEEAAAWLPWVVGCYGPDTLDIAFTSPQAADHQASHRWLQSFLHRASLLLTTHP